MRKHFLYFILLCFAVSNTFAQKKPCNYIPDYYRNMYQAYYAIKIDADSTKAYTILDKLNKIYDLLDTPGYYESEIYFSLCTQMGETKKAKTIAKKLIKNYGYTWEELQRLSKNNVHILDTNEYISLRAEFDKQKDTLLIQELMLIKESDQRYRTIIMDALLKGIQSPYIDSLTVLTEKIDSVNAGKLTKILEKGYPTLAQVGGNMSLMLIDAVFMHMGDTSYFAPTLLKYIKEGTCLPDILAKMIDSRARFAKRKDRFIYGIYENATKEDIYDYPNLNARRISIGLPTVEMEKAFKEAIMKEYEF